MRARPAALLERLRKSLKSFDFTVARRFGAATREDRLFYLLIAGVGVLAGVLGVSVHAAMARLQALLWGSAGPLFEVAQQVPWWRVVAAPAAGGLLVGLVYWATKLPASGGGMSQLIEAVALLGGKVPPRPVLVNAVAAIATVGSGGSLGREGPMIRLGAMVASWLGSRVGLPTHRIKILVGCGAAAGLAAAYNIPVGGAIFAMEVILGNFALEIFGPIVVSSVISTLIARALAGNVPIYAAPGYALESGWEILAYAGLGLVGAIVSVAFIYGVRGGRALFARLTWLPVPLRPLLGMGLLGALGVVAPHVLGGGSEIINLALAGELDLSPQLGGAMLLLVALPLAKLLATALTVGGGGSGGLFTPSLLVGALVGGGYGYWVHTLWPAHTAAYGAYAAVGMAAVAAGTSHAPISAILILFEFTGNYDLILPLMVAAILASTLSRKLHAASIYTESLRRRGVDLAWRMEEAVLAGLKAADLARPDADVLRPDDGYKKVVEKFLGAHRQRLFVVGEDGRLLGAISLHDIKHALDEPEHLTHVLAHDLMVPVREVVQSDERLHTATHVLGASDFERLPVVEPNGRFVGVLAKKDLLAVYAQEVLGRPALLATFVSGREANRDYVELPPDFAVRLVPVPPELVGKTLAEAALPHTIGARVLEIKRKGRGGEERVIPDAQTVLAAGDELVLLGPTAALEAMKAS